MFLQLPAASCCVSRHPPAHWKAYGSDSTPAPMAELQRVKTDDTEEAPSVPNMMRTLDLHGMHNNTRVVPQATNCMCCVPVTDLLPPTWCCLSGPACVAPPPAGRGRARTACSRECGGRTGELLQQLEVLQQQQRAPQRT